MTKRTVLSCVFVTTGLSLAGCASGAPKANIPSTANPQAEISKLDTDIHVAMKNNVDVLAPGYFKTSVKSLDEARGDLSKGKGQEQVLDDLRTGRGALEKAVTESENHAALAPTLFAARQGALDAGAASHPELGSELRALDADTSAESKDLAKASSKQIGILQDRYAILERRSVILNQLGNAQGIVNGAKKDDASKLAPQTLKRAELSLKNAESVIATNVRNPDGYRDAVQSANGDSTLLMEVLATMKQDKKGMTETTALRLVAQNHQIKNLRSDLKTNAAESEAAQNAAAQQQNEMSGQLDSKNEQIENQGVQLKSQDAALAVTTERLSASDQELKDSNARVDRQHAIDKARTQFSSNEAETYQQGNNLLIRLKGVQFATGRSDLPPQALPILAKVSEVAKSLNATEIKVEGHTDSVGSQAANKTISSARAETVATYLKSNGFSNIKVESEGLGFEKPIATNKLKEGRAQNRRVDIIISPEELPKSIQ